MKISETLEDLLTKAIETAVRKAIPDLYTFVMDKIYGNPHVLNVNLVKCAHGDHFRFVNLSSLSIHVVKVTFGKGKDTVWTVEYLLHPSTAEDPIGKKVTNRISFEPNPVFLYPLGVYFLPFVDVAPHLGIKSSDNIDKALKSLNVNFDYVTQEGKHRTAKGLPISIVYASERQGADA